MAIRSARLATLVTLSALVACGGAGDRAPSDDAASTASALQGGGALRAIDRIREIEDHRLLADARLKKYLASDEPAVAEAAAIAVGRIGDRSLTGDVIARLDAPDARVRSAAAFALGLLPGEGVEAALDARLAIEPRAAVRRAILVAIGQVGSAASSSLVTAPLVGAASSEEQAAAAEALATMTRRGVAPPSDASLVATLVAFAGRGPEDRAIASAFAVSALTNAGVAAPEAALTSAFHGSPSASARAYLARSMAKLATPAAIQALADASSGDPDPRVRADAARLLATTGASPATLAALVAALGDRASSVIVAAATALGGLGGSAASTYAALASTYDASRSAWVRSVALTALAAIDAASSRARIEAGLGDAWPVQLAAIGALPALGTAADVATLVAIAGESDTRRASAAIEAIATLDASLVTPAVKTAMRARLATHAKLDWEIVASVCDVAAAFGWTDFAPVLGALYDAFPGQENMNARLEIVYALGAIGSSADAPLVLRALGDDERLVSQTAADSYRQITGVDVSAQVRAESVVHDRTPSRDAIDRALRTIVLLETTRGPIVLRMLPEAPLSATNFVGLVSRGFYDGLPFHRVVPNFVAQGGDPRGDGSGGSPRLVREELSPLRHARGTVGMATEGKDTGSSQFFFNEGWNVSLDDRYTVFAEVVSGMDAAERLEVGDTIVAAIAFGG